MKKYVNLWNILAVVFCVFMIELGRAIAAGPFQFQPNWLAILPATAIWAAFVGIIIRKELAVAEPGMRKAKAGLVIAWTAFGERSGPAARLS